jgi:hypothetical protein
MSDKEIEDLQEKVRVLNEAIKAKADTSSLAGLAKIAEIRTAALTKTTSEEQLATQAWVKKETESKWWQFWKDPEIVGAAFAFTILKFELMSLVNFDPAIERWFNKRGFERNRFGLMWKIPKAERERRAKEIADAEKRLANMEKGIARLQDFHHGTRNKITNANGRIQVLERKVKEINTRSDRARSQIRQIPHTPDVRNATGDVQRLRAQVDALSRALTG